MDYASIAAQVLRAARGDVSQLAFSKKAGYQSNVAADWEHGRRFPTGEETLRICATLGINVRRALIEFHPSAADHLKYESSRNDVDGQELTQWLTTLRGREPLNTIAERCGESRFAVSRWLQGQTKPRLPDFLRLIRVLTGRLPEFVGMLVPLSEIPMLEREFKKKESLRDLAFREPWTAAVHLALQTRPYTQLEEHVPGVLARQFHIPAEKEARCLRLLEIADLISWNGKKFHTQGELTVDTRNDLHRLAIIKNHWIDVVGRRAKLAYARDLISYDVFSCSKTDFEKLKALHRDYFKQARALIANSSSNEIVGLLQINLFQWNSELDDI